MKVKLIRQWVVNLADTIQLSIVYELSKVEILVKLLSNLMCHWLNGIKFSIGNLFFILG